MSIKKVNPKQCQTLSDSPYGLQLPALVWMWFGAFHGAFGLGRAQPQRRVLSQPPSCPSTPSSISPASKDSQGMGSAPKHLRRPTVPRRRKMEVSFEASLAKPSGGQRTGWKVGT